MNTTLDRLCALVSPERLRELTLDLVEIPSPTGNSLEVSECYAESLRGLNVEVDVLRDFPLSPSTVARIPGPKGGRTLTLDGHLDTIHTPHVAPYVDQGRIYGRGSGDMKSGIAAMVEATRVLLDSGVRLGGTLILATHSLHEQPLGHMEGLRALIARGDVFVDAALVTEVAFDSLPIRGKGQALFEIDVRRDGTVLHENVARRAGVPNPLDHAVRLAERILARSQELATHQDELLGPPTFFLGQLHAGDFYNRVPTVAHINGTHRFGPDRSWSDIEHEFAAICDAVPCPTGHTVDVRLSTNGLGYAIDPQAAIVDALRSAYAHVVGREMPLVGELSVSDVNILVREAGIPTVAHGTGSTTVHGDLEWVELADIVRSTRVILGTILGYLGEA